MQFSSIRLTSLCSGRLIATEFLTLPDEDELPEYYEVIKLPVALETIEHKLKRNQYPTVTTVESDFKRLIQNAKDFNDPKSEIYEDAERIRKLVFNFMKVHNPAYKENSKYSATPTAIPKPDAAPIQNGTKQERSEDEAPEPREVSEKPKQAVTIKSSDQLDRKSSVAPSGTTGEGEGDGEEEDEEGAGDDIDFNGKTFQEAQQMIISYLLRYIDEE